jgi:hypothetical protein
MNPLQVLDATLSCDTAAGLAQQRDGSSEREAD